MLKKSTFPGVDSADALKAHERMASAGRKVVTSPAAVQHAPEQGAYKRWECQSHESDEMRKEYARMPCPDCGTPMDIRTSRSFSLLIRERYRQCPNVTCGATFRTLEEVVMRYSPSAHPNPAVNLPVSEKVSRDLIRHQMNHACVADHPPLPGAKPVTGSLFDGHG